MSVDPDWLRRIIEDSARIQRQLDESNYWEKSEELVRHLTPIRFAASEYAGLLGQLFPVGAQSFPDAAWMARVADHRVKQFLAASSAQTFAATAPLLNAAERITPILEQFRSALATAPDESARRLTLSQAARDVYEVVADREWQVDTPSARFKTLLKIVILLIMFVNNQQQDQQLDGIHDLLHDQVQLVATVADTVRQIQQEQERQRQHSEMPKPSLLVASTSNLREGPSPKTRRTVVVRSGDMLEEIVRVGRWYYVEVLASDGSRTGLRGWVYRRSVRRVK